MLAVEEKEEIANNNYGLIYHVVGKFKNQGYPFEELLSAAQFGFTKALNSYRNDKDVKFATFASTCMTNEILMFIRKAKKRRNEISIDAVVFDDGKGGEITLLDTLTSDSEEEYDWKEINETVKRVLSKMTERDKEIFKMFVAGKKQREVAEHFNLSQSYVSRIWMRTLQKIKKEYWREEPRTMASPLLTLDNYIQMSVIEKKSPKEIAEKIGLAPQSVYNWRSKNKEAIQKAQEALGQMKTKNESETTKLIKQTVESAGDKKYSVLEAAVKQLEEEKATWQERAEKAEKELSQRDDDKEAMRQANIQLANDNKKYKEEIVNLTEARIAAENELDRMSGEYTKSAEALRQTREENMKLKNKLTELDYERENLQRSLRNTRISLENVTKENQYLKGLVKLWA